MAGDYDEQWEEYIDSSEEDNWITRVPNSAKLIIFLICILLIGWFVYINQLSTQTGIIILFIIVVLMLWWFAESQPKNGDLTLVQAMAILHKYIINAQIYRYKYSTKIPEGIVKLGNAITLWDTSTGTIAMAYRIGLSITSPDSGFPRHFVGDVNIKISGIGVERFVETDIPYQGADVRIVNRLVLSSEYDKARGYYKELDRENYKSAMT